MGKQTETNDEVATVETISLADICKEMGIKPQGARVKLRKKLANAKGDGFRWVFPIEQKDEIVALLTPKAKAEGDEGEGEGDE
jgi:hypothetical protein